MDGHQRDLPIAQAEQSREAYAGAIGGCGLGPTAEAVALWVIEMGDKESWEGYRVVTARLPTQRALARRMGCGASSICRAVKELERAGLVIRPASRTIVLNLTRICELSNARATERTGPVGFARCWRPQIEPVESPADGGAPPRSTALHRAPPRSTALHRAPPRSTSGEHARAKPIRETRNYK